MSINQNDQNTNKDHQYNSGDQNDSSSQNNNGNIGREVDDEKEGSGSFKNLPDGSAGETPVNEDGVRENQESHWVGNHGQKSSNRPGSQGMDGFSDQNLTDGVQQNRGRNHVTNAGGTSQEDLEKGDTGLTDEENIS